MKRRESVSHYRSMPSIWSHAPLLSEASTHPIEYKYIAVTTTSTKLSMSCTIIMIIFIMLKYEAWCSYTVALS